MSASSKQLSYSSNSTFNITPPISTSTISYRFATMNDIPSLSTLAIETYKQTYVPALAYFTDEVLENLFGKTFRDTVLPRELNDALCQYFVCTDHTHLIGYAKLEFKDTYAYLNKLYVLNTYQGMGLGHSLIQQCFQSALNHGFKTMELDVWPQNDKAVRFYEKHGFQRGNTAPFLLFGKPSEDLDMKMTCSDIAAQVNLANSVNKH